MAWRQGEHVVLVGSTGSGKTTLAQTLLSMRGYSIAIMTKADTTHWQGWTTVRNPNQIRYRGSAVKYLFKPPSDPATHHTRQRAMVEEVLAKVWQEGSWCIYIDEAYYLEHVLKLSSYTQSLLTQGRSKRISVVLGVQRPAWVSRFALSEPTHILCSKLRDGRDIKSMREIAGDGYAAELDDLQKYDFLYLNRDTLQSEVVNRDTLVPVFLNQTGVQLIKP